MNKKNIKIVISFWLIIFLIAVFLTGYFYLDNKRDSNSNEYNNKSGIIYDIYDKGNNQKNGIVKEMVIQDNQNIGCDTFKSKKQYREGSSILYYPLDCGINVFSLELKDGSIFEVDGIKKFINIDFTGFSSNQLQPVEGFVLTYREKAGEREFLVVNGKKLKDLQGVYTFDRIDRRSIGHLYVGVVKNNKKYFLNRKTGKYLKLHGKTFSENIPSPIPYGEKEEEPGYESEYFLPREVTAIRFAKGSEKNKGKEYLITYVYDNGNLLDLYLEKRKVKTSVFNKNGNLIVTFNGYPEEPSYEAILYKDIEKKGYRLILSTGKFLEVYGKTTFDNIKSYMTEENGILVYTVEIGKDSYYVDEKGEVVGYPE